MSVVDVDFFRLLTSRGFVCVSINFIHSRWKGWLHVETERLSRHGFHLLLVKFHWYLINTHPIFLKNTLDMHNIVTHTYFNFKNYSHVPNRSKGSKKITLLKNSIEHHFKLIFYRNSSYQFASISGFSTQLNSRRSKLKIFSMEFLLNSSKFNTLTQKCSNFQKI